MEVCANHKLLNFFAHSYYFIFTLNQWKATVHPCRNILLLLLAVSYIPLSAQEEYKKVGYASFYHDKFEGRKTSSGEKFRQKKMTCAHRTLPFGTKVRVTNLTNNKSVIVEVNDRGPYSKGRIIDLSEAAAEQLDFIKSGHTKVAVEVINESEPDTDELYTLLDPVNSSHPGFCIQVGFFSEKENMLRMVERIKRELKAEVFVSEKKESKSHNGYHVFIGIYANRGEAFGVLDKIFNSYPGAFIVELK